MVPMKALVGFSLSDGSAAAGATFNAKDAKAADRLEAAGVAERVNGSEKVKGRSNSLPDPHS
ncbi:hypothetical protein [Brevundimonas naejangsanensis]|uniref:hypothetical protein n=1 Tax=Brevundimonas naejangsanensis TaxID=588932 RepID=UPI000ED3472A|nr:hypothetical protein [Brevundimonas naejangsanensis]HAC02223.1 hypothetical protein [Brevundimonas sp.]